jgi:RNA polymerase sigma-70 factor (ECF subfamily)
MGDQLKKIADERNAGGLRSLFLTFWPKVRAMLMRQGAGKKAAEGGAPKKNLFAMGPKSQSSSGNGGTASAWIHRFARTLGIDRARRQAAWQRFYEEFDALGWPQASVDARRSWEPAREQIETALGGLPPEQLQVIQLSFVDRLSQSEIAARLNVPLDTVQSLMRLAYEKLRVAAERGL